MSKGALSGTVITKTAPTPLPQQFDALCKTLCTCAGAREKGGGKAKTAIKLMRNLDKSRDFNPPMPSEDKWTKKADGNPVKDDTIKQTPLQKWAKECKTNDKPFRNCEDTMVNLLNIVIGQLGPEIINTLKGLDDWKIIDADNDLITLLKELKIACHQDNTSKVDPAVDCI